MDHFIDWFDKNSGYTLHRPRGGLLNDCCKTNLHPDNRQIFLPDKEEPLPLFRCGMCGSYYAQSPRGFFVIGNLLKYRVEAISPQKK